jgi:hypothetical protein
MACLRFDEKCTKDDQCSAGEVCCEHECGTQCRNVDLIEKPEEKSKNFKLFSIQKILTKLNSISLRIVVII